MDGRTGDAREETAGRARDAIDPIDVVGLDHLVLRCADVETTLRWYRETLGLAPVRLEEWRAGEAPFPSVRVDAGTIIDLVPRRADHAADATDGRLDHLCLTIAQTDLDALARRDDLDAIEGPAPRFGARGSGTSLYVRDPDGATVELRHYGPDGPDGPGDPGGADR